MRLRDWINRRMSPAAPTIEDVTDFPAALTPRHLTSVVMEEGDGQVIVTFGLGTPLTAGEYFGYAVDSYGTYRDASIGLEQVGTIKGFSHMGSTDADTDIPVTLLR